MASNQRLAAIMVTDIKGYTKLMGSNEEAALQMIQKNRSIHNFLISKFGGIYVKEIGDGTLAHFNSAYDAVHCGIAIQEKVKKELNAQLRIGIHLGEVVFENEDIFGDGVNIASRIEPLAEPGGICISETVDKALRSYSNIQTQFLGRARLKNVTYPIGIYAISGCGLAVPTKKAFEEKAGKRRMVPVKTSTVLIYTAIPAILILKAIIIFSKKTSIANAHAALVNIEQIIDSTWSDYALPYSLAKKIQKIIPDNPRLGELIKLSSLNVNVTSDPEGAAVYIKEYKTPEKDWQYLGNTPLKEIELPKTVLRWKLVKKGYDTVEAVATTFMFDGNIESNWTKENMYGPNNFYRKLDEINKIPANMVRVRGGEFPYGHIPDFFIDKYEVRNKDYKEFVDGGGYRNPEFWNYEFVKNNEVLSREKAMEFFVDKTGLPGPATWEAGTYPEGQDDYPVSGISWYEAAAYAAFAGKVLPTTDHWGLARGDQTFIFRVPQVGGYGIFVPFSNFNQQGPVETGKLQGITSYGSYDMAGNVREWCWNKSPLGRSLRGGCWYDNTYSFKSPIQAPALDRSDKNGFRCAKYPEPDSVPAAAFEPVSNQLPTVAKNSIHLSDETFQHYKSFYGYDKTDLNEVTISTDTNFKDWTLEKIQYDAAYNNEKIYAYLFLPKNSKPPFQTIIYIPGASAYRQPTSEHIEQYHEFTIFLDFLVKNGRAVLFPIYNGTFERSNDYTLMIRGRQDPENSSHRFTEYMTRFFKDFERSVDYLETRKDIDPARIGLYGMSGGAIWGNVFSALDKRIRVNILVSGGMVTRGLPEANVASYVSRVNQPTLMINGEFDSVLGIDNIKTMYNNLGAKEKSLKLYDTDHIPPRYGLVKESISWLDKYLGPVK